MREYRDYQSVNVDQDNAKYFKLFVEKSSPDLTVHTYRLFFGWHCRMDVRFLNGRTYEVIVDHDALHTDPTKTSQILKAYGKVANEDEWHKWLKRRGYRQVDIHPAAHDWYLVDEMPPADWESWGSCDASGACIDRWLLPSNLTWQEIDRLVMSRMLARTRSDSDYDWEHWARDGYQVRRFDMQSFNRQQHAAKIETMLAKAE